MVVLVALVEGEIHRREAVEGGVEEEGVEEVGECLRRNEVAEVEEEGGVPLLFVDKEVGEEDEGGVEVHRRRLRVVKIRAT